jgi:hypothetical protein
MVDIGRKKIIDGWIGNKRGGAYGYKVRELKTDDWVDSGSVSFWIGRVSELLRVRGG